MRLDSHRKLLVLAIIGCVVFLLAAMRRVASMDSLPGLVPLELLPDYLYRPRLFKSLMLIVAGLGGLFFIALPREMKAVAAIGGWPVLMYLEEGEGVYHWLALLRYGIIAYLWWLSLSKCNLDKQRWAHLQMAWKFHLAFASITLLLTLSRSATLEVGMVNLIKHNLYIPFLYISALPLRLATVRKYVVPTILSTALVVSVIAIWATLHGSSVFGVWNRSVITTSLGTWHRALGPMNNPNQLGTYLGSVLAFALVYLFASVRCYRYLPVWTTAVILMGLAVVLSFSRRVFVALPISLLIAAAMLRDWRSRGLLALGITMVLALAVLSNWHQVVLESLLTAFQNNPRRDVGIYLRLEQVWRLLERLRSPVQWAVGLGSGAPGMVPPLSPDVMHVPVDSYYLSLLAEYGLLTVISYLCLMGTVLSRILKAIMGRRLTLEAHSMAVACVSGIVVILLVGLVGNTNFSFPIAMNLWVFAGLAIVTITEGTETTADVCSNELGINRKG